jgi:hypothetical protein
MKHLRALRCRWFGHRELGESSYTGSTMLLCGRCGGWYKPVVTQAAGKQKQAGGK